tara:strand:+ start:585 stop:764 length:180 start_codon:yes stop_codon:yes gene_type:complete
MKKTIGSIYSSQVKPIRADSQQMIFMSTALLGLNLLLMMFVGLYWVNPNFHLYLSGNPL